MGLSAALAGWTQMDAGAFLENVGSITFFSRARLPATRPTPTTTRAGVAASRRIRSPRRLRVDGSTPRMRRGSGESGVSRTRVRSSRSGSASGMAQWCRRGGCPASVHWSYDHPLRAHAGTRLPDDELRDGGAPA